MNIDHPILKILIDFVRVRLFISSTDEIAYHHHILGDVFPVYLMGRTSLPSILSSQNDILLNH